MKIVHLVHNFPPEFRGGTEVYLEALCRVQAESGHEVIVVAGSEIRDRREDLLEESASGFRLFRFFRRPDGEPYGIDFRLDRFVDLLLGFLAGERPDVVHLHHWMNLGNSLLEPTAAAGYPSLATLHDLYALCPRFFMVQPSGAICGPGPVDGGDCADCAALDCGDSRESLLDQFRARRDCFHREFLAARRLIVPSKSHGAAFIRAGVIDEGRLIVLPHGLVRPVSRPVWKENVKGRLRVGSWGNLVPAKGIHLLLDAVHSMGDLKGDIEIHLFGRPIDETYGTLLAEKGKGLHLFFHGEFSERPLEEVGRNLDVAVFPSLARESYSMVLDEAIALGLPAVVSDAGAMPERVGGAGVVVPSGDAFALGRTLKDLAEDRGRLAVLARAAGPEKWTIKDSAQRLLEIYGAIVKEVLP